MIKNFSFLIIFLFCSNILIAQIRIGGNLGVSTLFTAKYGLIDLKFEEKLPSEESLSLYKDISLTSDPGFILNLNFSTKVSNDSTSRFALLFRLGYEKNSWTKKGILVDGQIRRVNGGGVNNTFEKSDIVLSEDTTIIQSEAKNSIENIVFDIISCVKIPKLETSLLLGIGIGTTLSNNTSLTSFGLKNSTPLTTELYNGKSTFINDVQFSGIVGIEKEFRISNLVLYPTVIYRRAFTDISTVSTVKLDNLSFTLGVGYTF